MIFSDELETCQSCFCKLKESDPSPDEIQFDCNTCEIAFICLKSTKEIIYYHRVINKNGDYLQIYSNKEIATFQLAETNWTTVQLNYKNIYRKDIFVPYENSSEFIDKIYKIRAFL